MFNVHWDLTFLSHQTKKYKNVKTLTETSLKPRDCPYVIDEDSKCEFLK